jgi:phosphatidylglycerol---prolipoprotein diacylglyceryl transferase
MAFPYLADFISYFFGKSIYLPVPTFGTLVAIATLVGVQAFASEIKRREADGSLAANVLSSRLSDFTLIIMASGFVGARLFHILEYTGQFKADPLGMIFSRGGFTIIGGLIFGFAAGCMFVRRLKLPIRTVADAAAPALMLAYAIGRLGCQLSGDGDWGQTANLALKPDWLPTWLWAERYTNNIIQQYIPYPGVYPTPIYECVAGLVLFAILWRVRKHHFAAGWLFSLYLLFSGVERLLIEQIRVNSKYHVFGYSFTQAEALSSAFIVLGIVGLTYFARKRPSTGTRMLVISAATLLATAACSSGHWS